MNGTHTARPARHAAGPITRALALCVALTSRLLAQGAPPPGPPMRATGAPSIAPAELARRVGALAESLTRQDQFSGVILLARNGRKVFERPYGVMNRETKQRMTLDAIANVSSIGKLFTQAAIAQLEAAGKLSRDSTIAAYWPDYPDPAIARKVTLRHLLEHNSGITANIFENLLSVRSNRDYLPAATKGPLSFEPGTRQQYSNAGYVILGEIIERVSHEVYHEYIQRHVFAPAGMRASGFPALDSLPQRAAIGYTRGGEGGGAPSSATAPLTRAGPGIHGYRGSAAGGAYSNVNDLFRFLLSRRTASAGGTARRMSGRYGGGSPGSNVVVAEGLPDGYDLIVLTNLDPPAAEPIADSVEVWLGGGGGRMRGPGAPGRVSAADAPPDSGRRVIMRAPGDPEPMPLPDGPVQPTLPDTPQGRAAAAYFRAFSSGDAGTLRTTFETLFTKGTRPTEARVAQSLELFNEFGALTVVGVRAAPDGGFVVDVASAKQGTMNVMISFEAAAPYRISSVGFRVER
jgi:D-alanyl-D-alanine carboxypeptidase